MSYGLGIDYEADHEEMENDRGATIKFRGVTISALVSIPDIGREFDDEAVGYSRTANLRVSVRDSEIPSVGYMPIKSGEKLEYDKQTYRIENVVHDSTALVTLCECIGEAQ